jgi:nucleoside-diphosphate kinase
MERELLIVKPDAVKRGLVGEVIQRVERKGLKLVALEMMQLDRPTAEKLYSVHEEKPFYEKLIDFMLSGPIVALVVEGENAIQLTRLLMGATDPLAAQPGTIRGDYSDHVTYNLVHGSDAPESVQREIPILFGDRVQI